MAAAPAYISDDLAHARDQVRWFPALVSNHVVDLVKRYHDAELPAELTDYIAARERYDYAHHGRTGSENAEFVTDEVVDRFCVLGTAEQVRAKLGQLEDLGMQPVQHLLDGRRPAGGDPRLRRGDHPGVPLAAAGAGLRNAGETRGQTRLAEHRPGGAG